MNNRFFLWRCHRAETLCRAAGLLAWAFFPLAAQAARPSYDEALRFGYELQKDYGVRQSEAIISRLDDAGMRRQIFSVFGPEGLDSEAAKLQWKNAVQPAIKRGLGAFDKLPIMVFSRVLLLEGRRELECVLLDVQGRFQVMTLWLNQNANGTILINDFKTLGSSLECTRRLRHISLLTGAPFSAELDKEEQEIAFKSEADRIQAQRALAEINNNRSNQAFRLLSAVSAEVKVMRVWQDLRDGLAAGGCEEAQAQVMDEYRRGRLANRFFRFLYAQKSGEVNAAIKQLDDLIEENNNMPFLRIQKAELLVEAGLAGQALELARNIYGLNPYSGGAYIAGLHAAVALQAPRTAVETLREWSRLMPAAEIDKLLQPDKPLEKFLKSPEYARWKNEAETAGSAISPSSP